MKVESKLILPVYFSSSSSFLLQVREINSRRAILTQFFFYLQHLLSLEERKEDVNELIKKVTLLLKTLNRGKEYVDYLQNHSNRESVWIEWKNKMKEKEVRSVVPKQVTTKHVKVELSKDKCTPGDRRTLCRKNQLDRIVCSVVYGNQ